MAKKHYQAYTAAQQTTASTRQIVMLYDGVLRNLQSAREAMQKNSVEERFNGLVKASEIIFGLQGCLDYEQGGDVAKVLDNFYTLMDLRVFALHRDPDPAACDQVMLDIRRMRDVWDEIDRAQTGTGEAAPAEANSGESFTPPPAIPGVTLSA